MINNDSKPKSGRGRTTGSYSFVTMKLQDLIAQLGGGSNVNVVLSRKWVESLGLQGVAEAKNSIQTLNPQTIQSSGGTILALTSEVVE